MAKPGSLALAMWMLVLWPSVVWACAYPAPVRVVNAVLLDVLNGTGTLRNHERARLSRAMEQLGPDAVAQGALADLSWREARAVREVIESAATLARGIGREVNPDLRGSVTRVRDSIQISCVQSDAAAAGQGEDATGAERGTERNEGSGGRALTFGEGVARLTMIFTLYMIFLLVLFALRRHVKLREAGLTDSRFLGQAESVSPGNLPVAKATPAPVNPANAMPPHR